MTSSQQYLMRGGAVRKPWMTCGGERHEFPTFVTPAGPLTNRGYSLMGQGVDTGRNHLWEPLLGMSEVLGSVIPPFLVQGRGYLVFHLM